VLLVVGGVVYLLGVLFFINDRPRLAPRVFSHHEVWHIVVIVASVIHFVAVWRVISVF
jgi:hemolysin III